MNSLPKTALVGRTRAPPRKARVFLGLDPGLAITGYAVLTVRWRTCTALAIGVIRTPAGLPLAHRLLLLHDRLDAVLTTHRPTEAAIEQLFFGTNRSTAIDVAQARGVLLLTLCQRQIPATDYTPSRVKVVVTGSGRATKIQVGEAVQRLLRLTTIPRPDDAADAAAVALCHALTNAWCQ